MVKAHLITDPNTVINNLNTVAHGLEKVREHSRGDVEPDAIVNDILQGKLWLIIFTTEEGYQGFACVKPDVDTFTDARLIIQYLFLKPGVKREEYVEGLGKLEKYAARRGYKKIVFCTLRDKAFERKMRDMGWTQTYVEFEKEVKDG
jgi:hypothetical protein